MFSHLPLEVIDTVQTFFAAAAEEGGGGHHGPGITILWIAVILLAAKISGIVERFGQPTVLGELVMGVILGNLVLLHIPIFEPIKSDHFIEFLSQLGVIILLFQVGLETNVKDMQKVGVSALLVAIIGVVAPFVIGTYLVGPWLLPGQDFNVYMFLGATLTATSVGITARVFQDLGRLQDPEARIILGAAVIDDVLGLIILAVVSAIVTVGQVSPLDVGWIIFKSVAFLGAAVFLGQLLAQWFGTILAKINTGVGMKFTLAVSFCLVFAYLAEFIGLAPIVGAFAAGLVLDPIHFHAFDEPKIVRTVKHAVAKSSDEQTKKQVDDVMDHHSHAHVEEIIEPLSLFLVPIFFVFTGMAVRLETMFDMSILGVALAITVAAVIGKIVSGLAAGKVNKAIVGWGMVPRGEVGLIFATVGKGLGVVNDEIFSIIVIMVIISTLLPPPILAFLLKKNDPVASVEA